MKHECTDIRVVFAAVALTTVLGAVVGCDKSSSNVCTGINCSGHGSCVEEGGTASCDCESGYVNGGPDGLDCVDRSGASSCDGIGCSGHGTCMEWSDAAVCACDPGFTPSGLHGLDCVPTNQVCVGGPIDYDYDNDGRNDSWFEPNASECEMYELVNRTRATHDNEGTPECHTPLLWNVEWSAHGRNHSIQMQNAGNLYHDDYPSGQNCAYGCGPACEMGMYMTGPGEDHCPPLSHHCNIMNCRFDEIGIGYSSTWNTQNFL